MKTVLLICTIGVICLSFTQCTGQKQPTVATIAFYNLENLFDTIDAPDVIDEEFLPESPKAWNTDRYKEKINNISKVIHQIGVSQNSGAPDVVGICEVENKEVVEDLISSEALKGSNMNLVHFNSPDARGIDVALIYKKSSFKVSNAKSYALKLLNNPNFASRDQLLVSGTLLDEKTHFIVNHWPSRRGGQEKSDTFRIEAAKLTRHIIDSLQLLNDNSRIIVMGDFNDDPHDKSITNYLKSSGNKENIAASYLFNPMDSLLKSGIGTLEYRDIWNLFDQIIISPEYLHHKKGQFNFQSAHVFNKDYLQVDEGKYKGYPKRTYVGNTYHGGYSDHFPSYILLSK